MTNQQHLKKMVKFYLTCFNKDPSILYNYFIDSSEKECVRNPNFEMELIQQSEYFFIQAEKIQDPKLFEIGKILRKAGHTIYRNSLKKNKEKPFNIKFLNLVWINKDLIQRERNQFKAERQKKDDEAIIENNITPDIA